MTKERLSLREAEGRKYRFIYFIPDPFNGTRHSIGAIVGGDQNVQVVLAELIPCEKCVGSYQGYMILRQGIPSLKEIKSFDELPMSFGPHFKLSEPRYLEEGMKDPVSWLREEVLPRSRIGGID